MRFDAARTLMDAENALHVAGRVGSRDVARNNRPSFPE